MGCNISPRRDAVREVETRARKTLKPFKVVHENGTGGWKHVLAADPTTEATLRDRDGREIVVAYRPIVGER